MSSLGKEKFCADCDKSEIKDEDIFCDGIKVNSVRYATCKKSEDKFGKWTFNFAEDDIGNYDLFDNKEDAIIEGKYVAKNNGLDHFYIGKTKEPIFSAIDGESYLEAAAESLGYEVGVELSDQWYESVDLKDINKLEEMLDNTFEEWKKETNNIPKCYSIVKIQKIEI